MRENIYRLLVATAQAMGQQLTVDAARLIADDLVQYNEAQISDALRKLRRKGGRFGTSGILEFITAADGRPSPDKAWAMMPKDELDSAVITQEMAEAWRVAYEQYGGGDIVGAQIAFKREYSGIVEAARDEGLPVRWFASLGHEPSRRVDALAEAVELKRIAADHAIALLAGSPDSARLIAERAVRAGAITPDELLKIAPPAEHDAVGKARIAGMIASLKMTISSGRG